MITTAEEEERLSQAIYVLSITSVLMCLLVEIDLISTTPIHNYLPTYRSVVEDHLEGRHWNAEDGGCEGIEHPSAGMVPHEIISRNLWMQIYYNRNIPSQRQP